MSLSQTLKGLHWDRVPNDNDDEVAARGILYLLIFQQLGQLVRWSWGYHVLLAPRERYVEDADGEQAGSIEGQEPYRDNPDEAEHAEEPLIRTRISEDALSGPPVSPGDPGSEFRSGEQTPVSAHTYSKYSPQDGTDTEPSSPTHLAPPRGPFLPRLSSRGDMLCFPSVEIPPREHRKRGSVGRARASISRMSSRVAISGEKRMNAIFEKLPPAMQKLLSACSNGARRFLRGVWDFMNPPLWAMLVAIVTASVPSLQHLFFDEGTFVHNSVTRAIGQNAQVAVPLILVVLGANLARNTLPEEALLDMEHPKEENKLILASLLARMFLPTLFMAPFLAFLAKYVPVSILDDPIFVIVCFLLTGAPSALQLAQICQINNVYVSAMSKLLFQSYVVWYVLIQIPVFFSADRCRILPSTLVLVMCAMEVVEWASNSA